MEEKNFNEEIEKYTTSTKSHADEFNKRQDKLLENDKYLKSHLDDKISQSGGKFTGIVKAQNNTSYTVAQLRNVILSANDADINLMNDSDIWIKYK